MSYASIATVRSYSGFDNESQIGNALIVGKLITAEAMVNSALSQKYSLPLAFRKKQVLTFAGTVTTGGSIVITINGTAYTLAVVNGNTASVVAAAFYALMVDSDDFCIEQGGEVIILTSQTRSDTSTATAILEVTVDSIVYGTSVGITVTGGGVINRYPALVEHLTAEIAAALLLSDNYGAEAQDTPKDGKKRLEDAMNSLKQIQGNDKNDNFSLKVIDECTGAEIAQSASDSPGYLPNETTNDSETDPTTPKSGINDIF
jgi:hypothetical protein